MKIIDVCEFYAEQGGGVKTYVHQKLRAAKKAGVDMMIAAPGERDFIEEREGGRIAWIKSPVLPLDPRYRLLTPKKAVHQLLREQAPDLIEGSSPWFGGWFTASFPGTTPRVLIFHQDPIAVYPHTLLDRWVSRRAIDDMAKPFWTYLSRLADHYEATICASPWLANRIGRYGVPRAEAVPFGIDKEMFRPSRRNDDTRQTILERCGARSDSVLLAAVSRHHPEKRLTTLLRAQAHLAREGANTALVVFGDGPMRSRVESMAKDIPRVWIAGHTANVEELATSLASADLFIHGSAAETFGLVVAEALNSGLPVVVPNAGGAADFAQPAFSEVYEPGDAVECAVAIQRAIRRGLSELRDEAIRASNELVRDHASHFEHLFATYEAIIQQQGTLHESRLLRSRTRAGSRRSVSGRTPTAT